MRGEHEGAEAYALGILDAEERAAFGRHLETCHTCQDSVTDHALTLRSLRSGLAEPPSTSLREAVLDLSQAPPVPTDPESLDWESLAPGIRGRRIQRDPTRGVEGWLVWARPGARHPRHRHTGVEVILLLEGALRDDRGEYAAGSVCRSRAGSVHAEEALPGSDCFCYVLTYRGPSGSARTPIR